VFFINKQKNSFFSQTYFVINFIDDTFSYLKGQNRIRLKTDCFKLVHTTEKIVEKLILNLNATSGAGFQAYPLNLSNTLVMPLSHFSQPFLITVLTLANYLRSGNRQ
jgi:hypothetical protein